MDVTFDFYFKCLSLALNNKAVQDIPEGIDYKKLFKIAMSQGVIVLLYYALKDIMNRLPKPFDDIIKKAVSIETKKDIQSSFDKEVVIKALEENGIDFMPLKGYFLKKMYPKTEMRYCSDCDILVDTKKLKQVKKLLLSLGLQIDHKDTHHDVFFYPLTKTIFEIHKIMFIGKLQKYFGIGFEKSTIKEGYEHFHVLNKEDFYISVLAHYAYHFETGAGVGAKSLCDIYILRNHDNLNYEYIDGQLKKCGLLEFKEKFEKAVSVVFENAESDEFTDRLLGLIYSSGYLNNENGISANAIAKTGDNVKSAKKAALLSKIFPPKSNIYFTYPFIKKVKILLPLGYVLRWFRTVFKTPKNLKQLSNIANEREEEIEKMRYIRKGLGF